MAVSYRWWGMAPVFVVAIMAATVSAQVCPSGWDCSCTVSTPNVPAGAAWGTVNNASFESGSSGGVGQDWSARYQSFNETPTYSVTSERATNGSYSQKIVIPSAASQQTSQRAGIYQQIYVVPGQTYTVSVSLYMEFDGSESYPGESFVAYVGADPYGDTGIGAGSITWSSAMSNKNQWATLQVQTTAVFEVMTLFACGMQKWEGQGTGRVWIDNFAVTGQIPVDPPSPPESEWVDPDSYMPETTGSELVTNGSFEGTWSGGLATSWNFWSTAGSGAARQSTRVGPIGGGKYDFTSSDTIRDMNPRVALTAVFGDADYWGTQSNMDDTVIVGRTVITDTQAEISDPIVNGRAFADDYYVEAQFHPRIDAWCGLNEPDWSQPNWTNALLWEKAFTERAHELGMKTVVLNLATGNPGNIWQMLEAQELMSIADYVAYHPYGGPIDQLMINASPALNDPCSYSLRWRKYVDMYRDRGWPMAPAIYTEGTTYGGWHGSISSGDIRDDLIAYGPFLLEDRWAVGIAIFCAGCAGTWEDWDIQGYSDIISGVGAWNMDNPTEATDGLYSQQFGAGNIHPMTSSEANNPDGDLTGGIRQQITGLTPGEDYLLDLDFRYEFRGLQPQVTFETGVDATGQTSNPNAGTISWSGDIIAAEKVLHDTWERTWRTFTATGTTASIWFRARQTVTNPAYRVSIDRVSVKQASVSQPLPVIWRSTSSISASCLYGTNASSTSFSVRNSGQGTINYTITDDMAWLSCSPTSGSSSGGTDPITVTYATATVPVGVHNGTITITAPEADNSPQTIAVTLSVSAPPTCTNNSIVNGGFESGISPWTVFGDTDGVLDSGFYGITAHGGSKMFGAGIGGGIQDGGGYQQIEVCDGADCDVTAWIYTAEQGGADWDVNCRIGIDPTGGTDPDSASIVWTDWENSADTWSPIGLTGGNSVTAQNDTVTIFLEHWHKWAISQNVTLFDDIVFTATGAAIPPENCGDGIDNDTDGLTDCCDPDCSSDPACQTESICTNGLDDDCDGDTDCADADCSGATLCDESQNCGDEIDNDGDGQTDCADADCSGEPSCGESQNCSDGIDNDGDGATDCADSDCAACDGDPTAVCQNITRTLGVDGTLTVLATEVAGDSTASGECCTLSFIGIRRPQQAYTESVFFDADDIATSPNVVYVRIQQSDGPLDYCTGYVTVEPAPGAKPVLTGAASRKTHTGAGDRDIDVGIGDIESRSAQLGTANPNELLIIATFDIDVALLGGSDVATDVGTVTNVNQTGTNELTVTITDLPLAGQVNLDFGGVVDGANPDPAWSSDSTLCVRVIVGDYDNLGRTNFLDFAKVKTAGYLNQWVDSVNKARADYDCGGRPNFLDFAKVRNAGLLDDTAPECTTPIGP